MPRLLSALAFLAVLIAAGCRQSQPAGSAAESLQIIITAEPNPPVTGEAQLVVTVRDAGGNPISDATVSVRGDMTHAGMTPVIRDSLTGQDGVYSAPFEWTMAGDWIVEVTVRLRDGTTATRTFKFTVSGEISMDMSVTAEATAGMSMDMPTPVNRGGG